MASQAGADLAAVDDVALAGAVVAAECLAALAESPSWLDNARFQAAETVVLSAVCQLAATGTVPDATPASIAVNPEVAAAAIETSCRLLHEWFTDPADRRAALELAARCLWSAGPQTLLAAIGDQIIDAVDIECL